MRRTRKKGSDDEDDDHQDYHHGKQKHGKKCKAKHTDVDVKGSSFLNARVYAPYSEIKVGGRSMAAGNFFGQEVKVDGVSTVTSDWNALALSGAPSFVKRAILTGPSPEFVLGEVYAFPNPAARIEEPDHSF